MANKIAPLYENEESEDIIGYIFRGCKCGWHHEIYTARRNRSGAIWSFNGDLESPTFSPSIHSRAEVDGKPDVCHFFIKDGQIEFLSDCTHEYAGKTVELWDFEDTGKETIY